MERKSKYDIPVWIIERKQITEMIFREYLETYCNDDTTTPEGVANRTQVRCILIGRNGELLDYSRYEDELDVDFYSDGEWKPDIKYGTFTWRGAFGNRPFIWNGDVFDTYEEAYERILDGFYYDFQYRPKGVEPPVYFDKQDAIDVLDIDNETE